MQPRQLLLEIDFKNNVLIAWPQDATYYAGNRGRKTPFNEVLKERLLTDVVPDFWHTATDELDFFQIYDDGTYFCQRNKTQYDFKTESTYKRTYAFDGATYEQALELNEIFENFFAVASEVKSAELEMVVDEIDVEVTFWEQRWFKQKRMKQEMLSHSDWRVLPDVEEDYEGEKDRWIAWRRWIRNNGLISPTDEQFNGSGLAYFKYTYNFLWPIDPKYYRNMYPNDMLEDGVTPAPAFMDPDDPNQWKKHDMEASSDFLTNRELNMFNVANRHKLTNRKITNAVKNMMNILKVEEIVPINWDSYYTSEEQLDE